MKQFQLERLKRIHGEMGMWLRDSEIDSLFTEIERQRALLERAVPFVQVAKKSFTGLLGESLCEQWIKDASEEKQ